ncbi:MAG: transglycosylase domain-containing protein [Streptosporangiaceae bacterium]
MSSPDFPGPSWRDRPELTNGSSGHGDWSAEDGHGAAGGWADPLGSPTQDGGDWYRRPPAVPESGQGARRRETGRPGGTRGSRDQAALPSGAAGSGYPDGDYAGRGRRDGADGGYRNGSRRSGQNTDGVNGARPARPAAIGGPGSGYDSRRGRSGYGQDGYDSPAYADETLYRPGSSGRSDRARRSAPSGRPDQAGRSDQAGRRRTGGPAGGAGRMPGRDADLDPDGYWGSGQGNGPGTGRGGRGSESETTVRGPRGRWSGRGGAAAGFASDGYADAYGADLPGPGGAEETTWRTAIRDRLTAAAWVPGFGGAGGRGGGRGPGGRGPGGRGPGGPGGPGDDDGYGTDGYGRSGRRSAGAASRPVPRTWYARLWYGSWWRRWTIKKALFLTGGMALGLVLVLVAGFLVIYSSVSVPIQALSKPLPQSSVVYFSNGRTPIGCFCSQNSNRAVLTSAQLSRNKYLEAAFFAAEDRHFLTEGGISLTGTARALLVDLTGSGYQGGSTITEQYVKSYLDPSGIGNLTIKEKVKEVIMAIKLARMESKTWILTHYLNYIYLGWGTNGVEAASELYFGKPVWKLSIEQCAMIASMVQWPAFNPNRPAQVVPQLGYSLLSRWVSTLQNMARDTPGITQAQLAAILPVPNPTTTAQLMQDLKHFPKIVPPNVANGNWAGPWRGYLMTDVENELISTYHLTQKQIYQGGLQIVTTISERKMNALYATVNQAKSLMRQYGKPMPNWVHMGAELIDPTTGGVEAVYEGPNYSAPQKQCNAVDCQYLMATEARNQVGSSFKPYVLATAVSQNMNVQTSRLNAYWPLCIPPDTMPNVSSKVGATQAQCPAGWAWSGPDPMPGTPGPLPVYLATAYSSNPAYMDLAHKVGTANIITLAQNLGVNISPYPNGSGLTNDVGQVGIALGIAPLTVQEQATTFATLADNGVYHTTHFIAQITENGQNVPIKVQTRQVLTPAQTANVDWALSFDTRLPGATAYPNGMLTPARPTIAKTGTTNVAQSAFFIGALPQEYSFAVGMFTQSQNNKTGGQSVDVLPPGSAESYQGTGYGGSWPATVWRMFMTRLLQLQSVPVTQIPPPTSTGFQTWIQAKPPQPKPNPKPKNCQPGPGNGNGHGHKPGPCPSPSGSPTPTPSPSPSGSPTPTPSPSPSGSPTPSPPPSKAPGNKAAGASARTTSVIVREAAPAQPRTALVQRAIALAGRRAAARPGARLGRQLPSATTVAMLLGAPAAWLARAARLT